jgi:phosphatidylglycerol:prolipoprotein diacylglycerol transferase
LITGHPLLHPILIDFGPFALHTYGLAMALAFAVGIWVAMKRAEARGLGAQFALDVSILILIFSLIGGRATYVLTHLDEYREHPLDAISPIQHTGKIGIEGLVLLGGVAAAFATIWVFARRRKTPFLTVTDLLTPPTALGIAIGRIGCFFNGCCFGLPTHVPWGVRFPEGSLAGYVFAGACVHPTQLYEAGFMVLLFGGLMLYDRRPHPTGRLTGLFLLLYGIGRFFIEQLRWYEREMILYQSGTARLTFSQVVSLVMVIGSLVLIVRAVRKPAPLNARRA